MNLEKSNTILLRNWISSIVVLSALSIGLTDCLLAEESKEWTVPLGGNTYLANSTARSPDKVEASGIKAWRDEQSVFSIYFRTDRAAEINLSLRLCVPEGESLIRASVAGSVFEKKVTGGKLQDITLGKLFVNMAGYVRVDLQGLKKSGPVFAEVVELLVKSTQADLRLDYVTDSENDMFYWGRRGPSVHLYYKVPSSRKLRFAYSEITVPEGQDPVGSFFMANGFYSGYFGMQVNSPNQRRVLFSIWSPYQTDNPREIPQDQRVEALAKGPGVRVGEFGNEGSGGQSFLEYPWKSGHTYRFLTEAVPDGSGSSVFTAWFGEKAADEWRLIASFRRPKTTTHLRGFHSFLENFHPTQGHIVRSAEHGNIWVCDTDGEWHECLEASFSVDATGGGRHRLDFAGGMRGERFFLRNGGFFSDNVSAGESFTRKSTASQRPMIDFKMLPRQ